MQITEQGQVDRLLAEELLATEVQGAAQSAEGRYGISREIYEGIVGRLTETTTVALVQGALTGTISPDQAVWAGISSALHSGILLGHAVGTGREVVPMSKEESEAAYAQVNELLDKQFEAAQAAQNESPN